MRTRTITCLALALGVLLPAGDAQAKKKSKNQKNLLGRPMSVGALEGPATLSSVNERWLGASAQTRVNLPIKKGSDKEGWSSSEWLRAESERIKMRFSVNSRDDLWEVLPQKNLLAGVDLVCDGWSVQNPKNGRGIQVDFRFVNYPARARAEFNTDMEHLAEVERFLRFNVMAVTRADEMLSSGAPAAPAAAAAPTPSRRPDARPSRTAEPATPEREPVPAPAPRERGIRITGARVVPESASPGEAIELLIEYEVASGDGSAVAVLEARVLAKGASRIAGFEETVERYPGRYTSRQTINVPAGAPPGFYSYQAMVSFGELKDEFSAIFEVR